MATHKRSEWPHTTHERWTTPLVSIVPYSFLNSWGLENSFIWWCRTNRLVFPSGQVTIFMLNCMRSWKGPGQVVLAKTKQRQACNCPGQTNLGSSLNFFKLCISVDFLALQFILITKLSRAKRASGAPWVRK